MHTSTQAVAVIFLLAGCAWAAEDGGMVAFPVDWSTEAKSPADLSFLLEAPAGKSGPVGIAGGHLVRGDGRRLKLWGVNATGGGALPAKEDAPLIAGRLAQSGVNCVRFHFLDSPAPAGILDAHRDDTRALDPAQMDRLDFFVAELKVHGIYTDLNLNVARRYKTGDGVRDCELLGFAKALTYFDARLLELQKEYARMLLTHRNPYTQAEYRGEPAVALVELLNENSLVESWFSGRLLGKNTSRNPGTWTDIPASYEQALTGQYNAWLRSRLSPAQMADLRAEAGAAADGPISRLEPKGFAKASKLRFETEAAFYVEIERKYFEEMAKFLHGELGVKAPLAGSSDHNHGKSGYAHLSSTSLLDIVDGHVYWQHPQYLTEGGKKTGFRITNTPMVDDPLHSTVVQLSRSAVAGKPYTVSEVNHPFPAEWACEGIPILAAYAAFHDWDGVFWYTLGHTDALAAAQAIKGHFDLFPDPVKMSQLRAGAMMFLRGDVAPARQTVPRTYSREEVIESLRLGGSEAPYFTPGFDGATALTHAVRIKSFDGPAAGPFARAPDRPIRCDTGELVWRGGENKDGLVVIDTPRSQALVGHCKAAGQATANMAARVETPFCALTLGSLDDRPIAGASRLLLTAGARVANSDMQWDAAHTSLTSWGKAPACIEPVTGKVVLRNLEGAKAVTAQPLDGAGRALGQAVPVAKTDAGWVLLLGAPPTAWYVVSVAR